jgi:hypothetical protein
LDEIPKPVVVALLRAGLVGMEMIIGRSLTPLNSSRTMGSVRRHDDNSRGKVQNVRGDSSADGQTSVARCESPAHHGLRVSDQENGGLVREDGVERALEIPRIELRDHG